MATKVVSGFDVELMKAIGAKAGLDVEFVNVGTDRMLPFIADCRLDGGIASITITDDLSPQVRFSQPYLTVEQVVVVKKGNNTIGERGGLAGMTVGAQMSSPSAVQALMIPGAQLAEYASADHASRT